MFDSNKIEDLRTSLRHWFQLNGRHWIPWKLNNHGELPKAKEKLPVYPIWIAEVMLQQTQLKVVIPFLEKWMYSFPGLVDVASASEQKVLLHWEGLGYYARAHRIHKASNNLINIMTKTKKLEEYIWPNDMKTWMNLPGIGRTTAASILSSAFDQPEAILDGNVKRIISRLLGIKILSLKDLDILWQLSVKLLDHNYPRDFNQSMMDLGATICTKSKPKCIKCPLKSYCVAYNKLEIKQFPLVLSRKVQKMEVIGVGIIMNNLGEVLIDKRTKQQSMAGMWEFPGGKKEKDESIENTIIRELDEELGVKVQIVDKIIEFEHCYTHKKLHFVVHICKIISGDPQPLESLEIKWVNPTELGNYPFPSANKTMIAALKNYLDCSSNKHILES